MQYNDKNNDEQDPYRLDNPYYSKEQLRNKLLLMNKDQREDFESKLSQEFKSSTRMPSIKSKNTLIIFAILSFLTPLAADRLYSGNILVGLLKLILRLASFSLFILYFINLSSILSETDPVKQLNEITSSGNLLDIFLGLLGTITSIWGLVDIILAAQNKIKDNKRRIIDL